MNIDDTYSKSEKGDVIKMKVMNTSIIVVSSSDEIKEVMVKKSKSFRGRSDFRQSLGDFSSVLILHDWDSSTSWKKKVCYHFLKWQTKCYYSNIPLTHNT